MKTKLLYLLFLLICVTVSKNKAQRADKITGLWLNYDKDSQIEIYKKGDLYYGKIIWTKEPNNEDGSPKRDIKNPDPKLRNQTYVGLEIIKDFKYIDGEWQGGTIYDPRSGTLYKCVMWFEDDNYNSLNIRGYVGFSLLGKTTVWTRQKIKKEN